MSSDWLFVLVFFPSVVFLATIIVASVSQKERISIHKAGYKIGYLRGREDLAYNLYRDVYLSSYNEEDLNYEEDFE